MDSCCRACSRRDGFRRFSLYAVAEVNQELIADMIRDTSDTQVSTEDGLPQQICPDCLMTLSLAYTFRKQCRQSDAKFREFWSSRTSTQQQQPHSQPPPPHSQPQTPFEGSFDPIGPTPIKNEMDIPDYEYSITSADNSQWVIQTPQAPAEPQAEGAMTVVHNTDGQYYDESVAASETSESMVYPTDDPSEIGECSSSGQNLLQTEESSPERYSQRIRRQILTEQSAKTWTKQQMSDALEAIQEGMSYTKASTLYNVPLALLHKRATLSGIIISRAAGSRSKTWTKTQMANALKAIQDGMSCTKASKLFNIPLATVHKRAARLGISSKIRNVWTEEQMGNAIQAVRDGMGYSRAAIEFNVPVCTLTKRAKSLGVNSSEKCHWKSTNWTKEQMNSALEAIQAGMSYTDAAKQFNIPLATVHKRAKLSGIGRRQVVHKNWTTEQMSTALKAIHDGMSVTQASNLFEIPVNTLYKRSKEGELATSNENVSEVEGDSSSENESSEQMGVALKVEEVNDDGH